MFRKILDKFKNINVDKVKRDAQIQKKRLLYNLSQAKKEIKDTWSTSKLYKNFPSYKIYAQSIKDSIKARKIDELYSAKRDKMTENLDQRISTTMKKLKTLGEKSKKLPYNISSSLLTFGKDTKDYISESYYDAAKHIKKYFKDNEKYFLYRKNMINENFKRNRRKWLYIGAGAVFIYAVGSNIPDAIVKYKLAKEFNKNSPN